MNEGWIYIIHFEPPYKHARHYLGFALENFEKRIERHKQGHGAKLVKVAIAAGCAIHAFVIKRGTRTEERRLKRLNHRHRFCPLCNGLQNGPAGSAQEGLGTGELGSGGCLPAYGSNSP